MSDSEQSILSPSVALSTAKLTSDRKILEAFLEVELAWLVALKSRGFETSETMQALQRFVISSELVSEISESAWLAGNPAVGFVAKLSSSLHESALQENVFHNGLTSQDLVDNALMLLAKDVFGHLETELILISEALAAMALQHLETECVTRTINRYAEPSLLGFRFAGWLEQLLNTVQLIRQHSKSVPVQAGGAAGNRAALAELVGADEVPGCIEVFALSLGLQPQGFGWHTNRSPVLAITSALAESINFGSVLSRNLINLGSPEVGELLEAVTEGQGSSSAMPHKRNPTRSILANSAGVSSPGLVAQIYNSTAFANERGNGEWQAQWQPFRELLRLSGSQATFLREAFQQLQINLDAVGQNLRNSGLPEAKVGPQARIHMQSEIRRVTQMQRDLQKEQG
jgi:3-carboxy-cis,cis-muconate cycloisomerase